MESIGIKWSLETWRPIRLFSAGWWSGENRVTVQKIMAEKRQPRKQTETNGDLWMTLWKIKEQAA